MPILLVTLIVPHTVVFHSAPTTPSSSLNHSEAPICPTSTREDDHVESYTTCKLQHNRSQSLTIAPTFAQLLPVRPPAAFAKTPGATTNVEDVFKPQQYQVALPSTHMTRNKSAASLQALVAAECQNKSWGKLHNINQPKSLAQNLPSQSIFDDAATTVNDLNTTTSESPRKATQLTKLARRKQHAIPYTTANYSVQPTTLGNTGLFAAINAVAERDAALDHFWIGTLGMPTDGLPQDVKKHIAEKYENDLDTFLTFIEDTDMNAHYENYCKNILWPMLHSQVPDVPKSKAYQDDSWTHYKRVNEAFVECIVKNYKDGDIVWVHDYHLLLVPALVREKFSRAQIGLFIHSAFPPSEIFRNLPSRLDLIAGMLGANMIAFQTDDFRYQFLQTCSRLLNIEATDHGLVLENGRFVDVFTIPMGIDMTSMDLRRSLPEVKDSMRELSEKFAGKYVIVSRDKLDGIHGLKHKLRGYAEFLDRFPHWREKVVLVQIATSTTQDIELRDAINNSITDINSDWGDLNYQPIVYLNQDIDYSQYLALLSIADCMLVTSLSEGMNLTCHEFVVCQDGTSSLKGYAPLVVSEFIGASKVFGKNALRVNPWHPVGIAKMLDQALSMNSEVRKQRWNLMFGLTKQYCARSWFDAFVKALDHAWKEHNARDPSAVPRMQIGELRKKYDSSSKRLLVIDFEGTLTTWDSPKESVITVPLRVINVLTELVEDANNLVYVMSQQTMDGLDHMFRAVPKLGLIAENGAFLRKPGCSEWIEMAVIDTSAWRKGVMGVLGHYTTSIPGSMVREIKSGIIFSYHDAADQEDAGAKAGEIANQINEMCENLGVSAVPIEKGLYISPIHVNKALATKVIEEELLAEQTLDSTAKGEEKAPDFVLAIGDSYEDECVFEWAHKLRSKVAADKVVTCIVGKRSTAASAAITQGPIGVVSLLEKLTLFKYFKTA